MSDRVREVQEKRARETTLETAESNGHEDSETLAPPLELLPRAEPPAVNPLVAAALRRIERAHEPAHVIGPNQASTALASTPENGRHGDLQPEAEALRSELAVSPEPEKTLIDDKSPNEKLRNLAAVPAVAIAPTAIVKPVEKPKRIISDDPNHPALDYLDYVPAKVRVEDIRANRAPAFARLSGAAVDLVVVSFLCSPFAAAIELTNGNWQNFQVAALTMGIMTVVAFFYLTISTALTGRTLGMRLLSLRVVDARTGLIPTGKQSAGRALIYIATLLTIGMLMVVALLNPDRRPPQDYFTHTAVILG